MYVIREIFGTDAETLEKEPKKRTTTKEKITKQKKKTKTKNNHKKTSETKILVV